MQYSKCTMHLINLHNKLSKKKRKKHTGAAIGESNASVILGVVWATDLFIILLLSSSHSH